MKYYYITHPYFEQDILEGISANQAGLIYVFENRNIEINGVTHTVAELIAYNRLRTREYLLFEIDSQGIMNKVQIDESEDLSDLFEWKIKQPIIESKYIKLVGKFDTGMEPPLY